MDGQVILARDFDEKSTEWNMKWSDTGGKELTKITDSLYVAVLNSGNPTTFRRRGLAAAAALAEAITKKGDRFLEEHAPLLSLTRT